MLIGIDASRALRKKRTGTEVYSAEIIQYLTKVDTKNRYRLYSSMEPTPDMPHASRTIEWRVMPFPRGWTLIRLSLELLFHAPNVLFIPAHTIPLISPTKTVVVIHDIGYDHFPELYKWTDIVYHHFAIHWAKLRAKQVIVPSEFVRQDIHEKYGFPLSKVTTIYHGFEAQDFRPKETGEASPQEKPYFYFVGRLEYKKNVSRMLEAFKLFKEKTGFPHQFILAGREAYGYADIQKTYESLGEYKKDVVFLGYTSQEDSVRYLRHADALVFATLFEGFGLPVLEAFASGTPAITSTTTSLGEIAGDAALCVEPTDTKAIAEAMEEIVTNLSLRKELIDKGNQRYKDFSWEKAATETLAVIEKVGSDA